MRRVAITGYGITSCLGNTRGEVLDALREGRSGIAYFPERKAMGFRSALAGKMTPIGPLETYGVPRRAERAMGPAVRMAVHAAHQALAHSGLPPEALASERTAVVIGHGGVAQDVHQQIKAFHRSKATLPGTALQRAMNDTISANLSILLGARGVCHTVSAACATGAVAIGQAWLLLQRGLQDRALAGGFMEDSWEYACQFDALKALSVREDQPERASRPFDKARDGLVPSAGGSIVVLEDYEQALARGATIRAELLGYSFASDALDMTQPSGDGGRRAIVQSLAAAGVAPREVDYVNAHATSTQVGDVVEARILAEIFGEGPWVSSTKSSTGHEGAAAGSNELVYTLLMLEHGFAAPSINIDELDPECAGIRVARATVEAPLHTAASTSFGFGGVNTCLVVRRP
jgi:3-oxoacyl-[acyl-carrier-protein] synthase-1